MINDETNNYYYFAIKNLSELNSLGWLQCKKEAIINNNNHRHNNDNNNNNNKSFQNALHDALNHQTIESNLQRVSKLKPYINLILGRENLPAGPKEWQKFVRNNNTIALNLLYVKHNTKKICVLYSDGKKYHYLAVTNLYGLLLGNSSNHKGDFYCLNCFNSYTSKIKLKEHEEICNNHNYTEKKP